MGTPSFGAMPGDWLIDVQGLTVNLAKVVCIRWRRGPTGADIGATVYMTDGVPPVELGAEATGELTTAIIDVLNTQQVWRDKATRYQGWRARRPRRG